MDRTILLRWSWTLPLLAAGMLTGCGSTHPLPPYETPLARTNVQSVRTTAYTHTESDHLEYGNHNALGGTLRGAAAINDVPLSPNSVAVAPPLPINLPGDQMRDLDENGYHGPLIRPAAIVPVAQGGGFHAPGAAAVPIPPGTPLTEVGRTGNLYENHLPNPAGRRRQRGGGLVAVAGGHGVPRRGHGAGLSGGRLRVGACRAQHHRPLPAHARCDERLGDAASANPSPAMG